MGLHIVDDLGLQCPSEKVQLSNRGHELLMVGNCKHDALTAAVRVKILLGVRLELALVAEIDEELLAVKGVTDEAFSAVFRDKPVNDAQTERCVAVEVYQYFLNFRMVGIEALKTGNHEFRFTLNLPLSSLWITGIRIHV